MQQIGLYDPGWNTIDYHAYGYDQGSQRTQQVFTAGNYMNYTYDKIGQLRTAKGYESDAVGGGARLHEKFGYTYDAAWNLIYRTNNALLQTFAVDSRNRLTGVSRDGTLTVAGTAGQRKAAYAGDYGVTNVTVSGTGLSTGAAEVYADGSWARAGATPASVGSSSYTATGQDYTGRESTDQVTATLPSSVSYSYDSNGNLLSDGLRTFEYDFENQLTNVYVASAWRSEFVYDALMRRRVRREFTWNGTGWTLTNEVRYVYDGRLVVQERDWNNLPVVTYTRGTDLSGELEEAGGIGGLLARTDNTLLSTEDGSAHAYYHADGNGNVTCLVNASNVVVARYSFDPFGNVLAMSGPLAEANLYRFSSKEAHPNSGLVYSLYRYYEPNLQRWLNQDPLGDTGSLPVITAGIPWSESDMGGGMTEGEFHFAAARVSLSVYTAIGNNLIDSIDPFGLDPFKLFDSPDAAGIDAACYIKNHPIMLGGLKYESAAAMFKNKDGKYYYNLPQHGKDPSRGTSQADFNFKMDPKDTLAGHIHDHIEGEDFSNKNDPPKGKPKDIELYKGKGIPGYLLTPSDDIKKYDPKNEKTTTIGNCK